MDGAIFNLLEDACTWFGSGLFTDIDWYRFLTCPYNVRLVDGEDNICHVVIPDIDNPRYVKMCYFLFHKHYNVVSFVRCKEMWYSSVSCLYLSDSL